jgi:hypothetical protein
MLATAFFLLIGCGNEVDQVLRGTWSIDTIYYKEKDIRNCVLTNVIEFEETFCELPTTENYCNGLNEYVSRGTWGTFQTDSIPLLLTIASDNKVFSGNHRINFKKDEINKLLKMELKSDSLYMICRKGLFNYDASKNLVDDLVELSRRQ